MASDEEREKLLHDRHVKVSDLDATLKVNMIFIN